MCLLLGTLPAPISLPTPAAQCRAVGGHQAGPDTVLADSPVPQRQFQALGAYQAGGADGDRRGRLVAGLVCFRTDRKPLVGIEGAVSAAGVPDDPGPQGLIGERDGRRRIRRPGSRPVQGVGGRPGIRRRGGVRNSHALAPFPDIGCGGIPGSRRSSHALLVPCQAPGLTLVGRIGPACRSPGAPGVVSLEVPRAWRLLAPKERGPAAPSAAGRAGITTGGICGPAVSPKAAGVGVLVGSVRRSPNPDANASSARVSSLGMSQVWLPSPFASLGNVCRYW